MFISIPVDKPMRKYVVRLTQQLDAYDPYGFYRVNGLQSLVMVTMLFLVQSFVNIPDFKTAMSLPLFALMIIGMFSGYYQRLKLDFGTFKLGVG